MLLVAVGVDRLAEVAVPIKEPYSYEGQGHI